MAQVLLVDDDSSVLLTLAIVLRRSGHEVTVACDANQALSQLRRHEFQFLISDVRMPGMSGLELAQRASKTARTHRYSPPRLILISAHYDPSLLPNPAADLAEAFLPKPIDTKRLLALLGHEPPEDSAPPPATPQPRARRARSASPSSALPGVRPGDTRCLKPT